MGCRNSFFLENEMLQNLPEVKTPTDSQALFFRVRPATASTHTCARQAFVTPITARVQAKPETLPQCCHTQIGSCGMIGTWNNETQKDAPLHMRLQTYLPHESDTPLRTHTPPCTRLLCMYGHRRTQPNWWRRSPLPTFLGLESKSWSCTQLRCRRKQGCRARHTRTHRAAHQQQSTGDCYHVRARACPAQQSAWDTRKGATLPHHTCQQSQATCRRILEWSVIKPSTVLQSAINWGPELCRHQAGPT